MNQQPTELEIVLDEIHRKTMKADNQEQFSWQSSDARDWLMANPFFYFNYSEIPNSSTKQQKSPD